MTAAPPSPLVQLMPRPDGVRLLRLCRPERRNALDRATIDALLQALAAFDADADGRVLVITGEGAAFCAGGDLAELAEMADAPSARRRDYLWQHIQRVPRAFERIDKPVIAAVNGPASGAGFDLALMCDLRIAGRSASFAESYIRFGLVAGDGGAYHLTRLLGAARCLELLWTGRTVTADEALALGIVLDVVDDTLLLERTLALASSIARQPPEAVRMSKRAVHAAGGTTLAGHLDMIASHMAVLYDSPEFKARLAAALQKTGAAQ